MVPSRLAEPRFGRTFTPPLTRRFCAYMVDHEKNELKNPDEASERIRQTIFVIAREMARIPDLVSVDFVSVPRSDGPTPVQFILRVAPREVPHFIGSQGRTANALRQIAWSMGKRHGLDVKIDVDNPQKKEQQTTGANLPPASDIVGDLSDLSS